MKKIKIVTDSSAGIPQKLLEILDIAVIDIPVIKEGTELCLESDAAFYEELDLKAKISTSAPAPGTFLSLYQKLSQDYEHIISIHISKEVSATYQSALIASELIKDAEVEVIDSKSISMAFGLIVIMAARANQKGATKESILKNIEHWREKVGGMVALPTLSFLAQSGRISQAKALIGNILALKPILEIVEGRVNLAYKTRTFPKALNLMANEAKKRIGESQVKIAVIHSNALEKAQEFLAKIKETINIEEEFVAEMGPGLAVHGGQNMLGLVWLIMD